VTSSDASCDILVMRGIARRFGTTVALDDVDLDVHPGEVHALVGENGAGKSTLMKVLAGAEHADAGKILLQGKRFDPRSPSHARSAGVAMIYQEFNLAPHLSVRANLLLGDETTRAGFLRNDDARCRTALDRLGLRIDLDQRVQKLGVADQQMLEIARALIGDAKLIIMDEPTSALAGEEVSRLFHVIRELRSAGIAIVYISHFLEELEQIADRITVLRDGRTVGTGRLNEWPRERIVQAMVGRRVEEMYPRVPHEIGRPLLTVTDLRGKPLPKRASFTLHRGEILGIAGLVGAGRTETLRTLFGLDPRRGGSATLNGVSIERFSPEDWSAHSVGLLSEDRKNEGLAQNLSCAANMMLPTLWQTSRFGWLLGASHERRAARAREQLKIKWTSPHQRVGSLSGGNQQKVAMARLLVSDADVLLLDEPTRGIDVGAKVDLYHAVGELAASGKAILIVSSYLPELFGICDRIAVMSRGVLSEPIDVAQLAPEKVMHMAT
jgi:ribose transport system ATP-binding protein